MKGLVIGLAVAMVTAGSAGAAFVVTSKNIKNGTIELVDISAKAKKALRGQRGLRGPQGPRGLQGIQAITEVQGPGIVTPPGQRGDASAACPEGQQPIAGGFEAHSSGTPGSVATVTLSRRTRTGWGVSAENSGTGPGLLFAYVYCSPKVTLLP